MNRNRNTAGLCSKDGPILAGLLEPSEPAQLEALQRPAPGLLFPCQRGGHQEFTVETWLGERGRHLGRDLHVKGPSEPYCCSVSPNLHVCTAQAPAHHCWDSCFAALPGAKFPMPLPLHAPLWHHRGSAQVTFWAVFPTLSWTNWVALGKAQI